jgi:hypothetical protein
MGSASSKNYPVKFSLSQFIEIYENYWIYNKDVDLPKCHPYHTLKFGDDATSLIGEYEYDVLSCLEDRIPSSFMWQQFLKSNPRLRAVECDVVNNFESFIKLAVKLNLVTDLKSVKSKDLLDLNATLSSNCSRKNCDICNISRNIKPAK